MTLVVPFLLGCFEPPLPEARFPSDTLVLRESFQGPGRERTGNWWGRFDRAGCWWEAHNTWLVVSDPALVESPSWFLHWNAVEPEMPWFCLNDDQRDELYRRIRKLEGSPASERYAGPVDRWTVQAVDGIVTRTIPRGSSPGSWTSLAALFDRFSEEGVWGQSPEPYAADVAVVEPP